MRIIRLSIFTLLLMVALPNQSQSANESTEAQAWFDRGKEHLAKGNYLFAVQAFQNAVRIKPDFSEAMFGIGLTSCEQYFANTRKITPPANHQQFELHRENDSGQPYVSLGSSNHTNDAQSSGQSGAYLTHAISCFELAFKMNPNLIPELAKYGKFHFRNEDYKAAIDLFRLAINSDKKNPQNQFWLGSSLTMAGDYQEATEAFKETVRLSPNYSEAWYCLGLVYLLNQDYQKAKEVLPVLEKLSPSLASKLEIELMP